MSLLVAALTGAPHPLWLVGFRPFFALACLSGLSLPILWVAIFTGQLALPPGSLSMVQWHAHEMFYGFGWAVLGGFLLTSTKNWVKVRGYHGRPLWLLAIAWLVERAAIWLHGRIPAALFVVSTNLFLGAIVVMLAWTLVRHRKSDTYRDNALFLLILPAFVAAKNLLLSPGHFTVGTTMTLGLFRMAFLIMFERTITQFMRGAFKIDIVRHPALDMPIKLLALALVGESLMPPPVASALGFVVAVLLSIRFVLWRPLRTLRRLDIAIMFVGYLALVAQIVLSALAPFVHPAWVGAVAVHVFTFGVMGLVIPAMLIRICNGHTGRQVVFRRADKLVLWTMMLGFALRIVAPQLHPAAYPAWLLGAAACWLLAFSLLAWRYIPSLTQPRVDGKEH
jgi:uncharacterized protein involved in response to NO